MDINRFMDKCIRHLGLGAMSLEEYYPKIQEILMTDTLSTFSQFFPYDNYIIRMNLTEMKSEQALDGGYIYYIQDEFLEREGLDIISVMEVEGASTFQDWNAPLQTFNIDALILEAAASNIRSLANISTKSFKFMPPNRIKLRGYNGVTDLRIRVKIPYPNFGYVPESYGLNLEQLAKLDIKLLLYPELKHYENLESADGQINLKLDGWENAEKERDDLLYEWRNKAFPNTAKKYVTFE